MSGPNSDQLHRSTLKMYSNIMEQFNPGLQKLVSLGNSYFQAFQALAEASEAYFSALAKMGEQALYTVSSGPLGDVLIQISDSQRRLTAELGGVFQWFHAEVLQVMDNNVMLDEDYIAGSRRHYEVEVRNQAAALERQLRRGAYRDTLESSEYMQFLRQSHREVLVEEERRYRFLAEKHCGLTQSMLYLINKTGASVQQRADGWKEKVSETRIPRARSPLLPDQGTSRRASVGSLLHTGVREEDREYSWAGREHQQLGKVPSRAPSPLPSRSRSSSVGESLGMGGARHMRALVAHPASSNPTLLPFSQDEVVTVMVQEPRNGWLYGNVESSSRHGWFPAAYVGPLEDTPRSSVSGTSNLLEQAELTDRLNKMDSRGYGEIPPPAPPSRRGSADLRPVTPTPERRTDSSSNGKVASVHYGFKTSLTDQLDRKDQSESKAYNEIPPSRRGSADLRPVTPTLERRMEPSSDSKHYGYRISQTDQLDQKDHSDSKSYSEIPLPAAPSRRGSADLRPVTPTPERRTESSSDSKCAMLQDGRPELFPRGTNPFATVKLRPTTTNDRSAPRIQ
ncbi:brain-specific angiogenesis inhibitor 1-associated protein 2-like protein 2 [Anguilla anguilla]|uniref:brain-specific angiogenesis inhibitor 1-associated protein 2-like protein 2 n=1 Tax=Anguilla anguilla TaxID=7936 RepID=UPI0015AED29A|nr:brain-specific angiogenesis inhibitor 1-associated protein 2-like protein 2 [Anguilla anguilla]